MITVQFESPGKFAQFVDGFSTKMGDAIVASVDEMGSTTAGDIVGAADFDNFTGEVRNETKYTSNGDKTGGVVTMPRHGVFVDRSPAHRVRMDLGKPQLLAWGMQAREPSIRKAANAIGEGRRESASIVVRPHPFIAKGFNRSHSKFEAILRRHIEGAFA